jgi:hypothetical protein
MRLAEAIELLEVSATRVGAAGDDVNRWNKENLAKIKSLSETMWKQMLATERLKLLQELGESTDELALQKLTLKKAKTNVSFRKRFVQGVANDIEAALKRGGSFSGR